MIADARLFVPFLIPDGTGRKRAALFFVKSGMAQALVGRSQAKHFGDEQSAVISAIGSMG
jgi:hypothetical protein